VQARDILRPRLLLDRYTSTSTSSDRGLRTLIEDVVLGLPPQVVAGGGPLGATAASALGYRCARYGRDHDLRRGLGFGRRHRPAIASTEED